VDTGLLGRIGLLCDQLSMWPSLYATIRDAGARTELDELLTTLADPHEPDRDRIRALLDAIDHACARVGLAGLTSRSPGPDAGITLPGGLDGPPGLVGWTCPLGRCDRVVTVNEAVGTPTCAAGHAAPMTPYTLPPR
jgi:hypothetical protein